METQVQRICAWCQPPRVLTQGALPATHTVCDECYRRMTESVKENNSLAQPNQDQ